MSDIIDTLTAERDECLTQLDDMLARDDFDPADDTYQKVFKRTEYLNSRIDQAQQAIRLRASANTIQRANTSKTQSTNDADSLSLGEAFVRSDSFRDYPARGTSRVFTRALPSTLTSFADALPSPIKVDTTPPQPTFPLLDVINTVQVSNNSVDFVEWTVAAGGSDVVAEGVAKPSVEYAPTVVSDTLDTVAVWTHLTRQLIEDAPAVRTTIDGFLRYDVLGKLNELAVGVLAGATLPSTTNADLLAAIRQAKGVVEAAGYMPNAVLLNPADYAALDIAVMANAGTGPNVQPTYWGMRPIPSNDQAEGTAVVGDFRAGMTQFTRGQVSLYISDSDQDDFIKNLFKILAEARSLFAVVRPAAFCETAAA